MQSFQNMLFFSYSKYASYTFFKGKICKQFQRKKGVFFKVAVIFYLKFDTKIQISFGKFKLYREMGGTNGKFF